MYSLKIGPPKQAANPIFGKCLFANEIFRTKSPTLLPHDNSDSPNSESLMLLTLPSVDRIEITSDAQVEMTIIEPTNEPNNAISCEFDKCEF